MNLRQNLFLSAFFVLVFISCSKEKSYEADKTAAHGSLQSDIDGTCLPKTVNGNFVAARALTSENYIELTVNVTSPGSYFISTDTLNGYYFRGTGNFTAGSKTVRLTASGTPVAAGTHNFLITFDSSYCYVPVTVLPPGTNSAVFTLEGSGGNCMDAAVSGTYSPHTALTADNKVTIKVNVSVAGPYSITTAAVNGMTFSASGTFTATGAQVITLTGNGTPLNQENSVITVTAGNSSCTFTVNVEDISAIDYFPRTANSNWTYSINGDMEDTIRYYVTPQTVSAGGNTYSVFMGTDGTQTDTAGLYRKSGNDYFNFIDIGSLLFDTPQPADFNFLKDNVASGTSWNSNAYAGTAGGLPVNVRAKFTITKKDETVTVNGIAYPNTITVKNTFEVNPGAGWTDYSSFVGYTVTYYSRNIGLIRTEYYGAANALQETDDLVRYQVF